MHKRFLLILAALALFAFLPTGCKPEGGNEPEDKGGEQTELLPLKVTVPVNENWIFDKRPAVLLHIENPNEVSVTAKAVVRITSDFKESITTIEKETEVPSGGTDLVLTTDQDLKPGFYKAAPVVNNMPAKGFFFGVNPFQIVSAPDMQEDFDEFWENARSQLPPIDGTTVTLYPIEKKSTDKCKVYMVELQSVPDGPDGDPVICRGYYLEPQDGKPHPVIMHFQGYDTLKNPPKVYCPSANNGDYAEFQLSHRGQYINHRTAAKRDDGLDMDFENIYGDWFAYNFGNRDGYYYRGAFMDCVQAVRFMASRPTSDMKNLFAEGSSQGGALCYAAAALSDIPFSAIAPNVAFLGDFPDYFRIVTWPGDVAKKNQGTMTDQEMYAFLSYFDTKNLATRITCAVWATSGLQDQTCPSHTNVAPFNNLKSTDKVMNFYPEMQHSYPSTWTSDIDKFFKARIK
ncbi:MAG: acetylxylan esterase [Bacteroidales bacterium]|nr:acetylxylan esterase [Bacteroidales bacterium]